MEEMLKPRIWLMKFKAWVNLLKKGCPASGGPGGIFCFWIGRNCCYNDCPRRSFEETEYLMEYLEKVETSDRTVANLRIKINQLNKEIAKLKATAPS